MNPPSRILQPGEKLGSYVVKRLIGKGGMGVVYEAERIKDGQTFAIKALTISDSKRNFEYTRRFLREARLAAAISHPNVVKVIGFIQRNHDYYIVMEYFRKGSVKDELARLGRLSQYEVVRIGIAVAKALEEAAKVRIVHRDIKPDNIMLATDGTPRLADLGLATLTHEDLAGVDEDEEPSEANGLNGASSSSMQRFFQDNAQGGYSLTLSRMAMGTPAYMAPEQAIDSRGVDTRADIYSLGATLFHLVCGEPPFQGKNIRELLSKQLHAPVPNLASLCPGINPQLVAVINRCLEKNPDDRYQDAGELAAALEALGMTPMIAKQKMSIRSQRVREQAVEFITPENATSTVWETRQGESRASWRQRVTACWGRLTTRDNLVLILEILIAAVIMGFVYYFNKESL